MIQYRLGAFGFLASDDVHKHGALNAGLLDMRFALEWTQKHISKFGGDPSRVTLAGESSGAGAAMLQAMAYGGREDNLFNNVELSADLFLRHTDGSRSSPQARIPRLSTITTTQCPPITITTSRHGQDAIMEATLPIQSLTASCVQTRILCNMPVEISPRRVLGAHLRSCPSPTTISFEGFHPSNSFIRRLVASAYYRV